MSGTAAEILKDRLDKLESLSFNRNDDLLNKVDYAVADYREKIEYLDNILSDDVKELEKTINLVKQMAESTIVQKEEQLQ